MPILTPQKCIKFVESLKLSKDRWRNKQLKLIPWQRDFINGLLAIDPTTGHRKHTRGLLFIPRKNMKSTTCAALSLAFLCLDAEQSQVICAASTREQAQYVFDEAASMARKSPTLAKLLKIRDSRKTIYFPGRDSYMKAISADSEAKLGDNISHVIADEIAIWPDSRLWNALLTSQGVRRDRIAIALTTAGLFDPEHFAYQMYELGKKCIENPELDPRFLPIIYEATPGYSYDDPEVHKAANPAYGVALQPDYFDEWMVRISNNPSELDTFLRFHLNVWVQVEHAWLPKLDWTKCGAEKVDPEALTGETCYAGLDLSAVSDTTSLVLAFPRDDGSFKLVTHSFVPAESAKQRELRDKVPYLSWHRQGKLELTAGNVIDYNLIVDRVCALAQKYNIKEVACDVNFQGMFVVQELKRRGIKAIDFGQGFRSMALPVREIYKLVLEGKLHHGNHPLLTWQANNVVTVRDDAGNEKFSKQRSRDKIDAMVSLAMAIGRAMQNQNKPTLLTLPLSIKLDRS